MQAEEEAARDGQVSVEDVQRVADELDIDARHVESAMSSMAEARRERIARRRLSGIITAVILGLSALVAAGGALTGSSAVSAAHAEEARTASALDSALSREATLAPQLIALSGGDAAELNALASRLSAAPDIPARLSAAGALGAGLATALGSLPPAGDPSTAEQRLNLQYEVVGAQNRIATQRHRWEDAHRAWEDAATSPAGRLAVAVGLAEGP